MAIFNKKMAFWPIFKLIFKKGTSYHYEIPLGLLRGIYSNSTNNLLSATAALDLWSLATSGTQEVSRLATIVI